MLIKVKVVFGDNKDKIITKAKNYFEVHTKAKPIQGMANLATILLLSKHFQISKEDVKLVKGFKARSKIFKIKNYQQPTGKIKLC